jgi:hypothetical protein
MRNPGERSADRGTGRRRAPAGRNGTSGQAPATGGQPAPSGSALFVPGYSGQAPAADPARAAGARTSGGWSAPAGGTAGKGPVRGFPPAPGQPPPVYPPGQFSAWNRAFRHSDNGYPQARRTGDGWAATGYSEPGYSEPGYPESGGWYAEPDYADPRHGKPGPAQSGYAGPGYSAEPGYPVLAVSDPAADVTSTQTWGVVDAYPVHSGWAELRAPADDQLAPGSWDQPAAGPARPAPAGRAGLTAPGQAGQAEGPDLDPAGRGRPDTGGHRSRSPRPGPAGLPAENGSPGAAIGNASRGAAGTDTAAPPSGSPGPRTDRPHPRRAHARARSRGRYVRLLLAGALVLVLAAGTVVYLFLAGGSSSSGVAAAAPRRAAPAHLPASAAPSATPTLGQWGHIVTRAGDPLPLSLGELFPASFSSGGSTYTSTVQHGGTNCTAGVIGSALQSAVRAGKCTQVMRASYLSGNRKLMGTIGVLNLISLTAAERSGKAAGGGDFIAQLAAAKGPTRHLTSGTGLEETEVKGHYLVLVWAEFADLRAPRSKAQRLELEAFCNRIIQNTANLSLASREITGKPRTP